MTYLSRTDAEEWAIHVHPNEFSVTVHGHTDGPELSRFGVAIFPGHMAVQGLGT
jgi:hypothetical protein